MGKLHDLYQIKKVAESNLTIAQDVYARQTQKVFADIKSVNIQPYKREAVRLQIHDYLRSFEAEVIRFNNVVEETELLIMKQKQRQTDYRMANTHTQKPFQGLWAHKAAR
jgi:hypothetical protein